MRCMFVGFRMNRENGQSPVLLSPKHTSYPRRQLWCFCTGRSPGSCSSLVHPFPLHNVTVVCVTSSHIQWRDRVGFSPNFPFHLVHHLSVNTKHLYSYLILGNKYYILHQLIKFLFVIIFFILGMLLLF